jgi:hypothetical protein
MPTTIPLHAFADAATGGADRGDRMRWRTGYRVPFPTPTA